MTVIAFKSGVLAADTMICAGNSIIGYCPKIVKNKKGNMAGVAGNLDFAAEFIQWFMAGEKGAPPSNKDATNTYHGDAIVIHKNGNVFVHERQCLVQVMGQYYAIGSGSPEALGAMHAGADAIGAVKAAIAHDIKCGGDILVKSLKGPHRLIKAKA